MQSKITLIGMYNYDNTIFDNLVFPAGIDKSLAVNRILNKSEEFEVLYSDSGYLKDRIGIWGEIWERTFTKWVEALSVQYDPLHNYDRHEIYTDTKGREYKDSKTDNRADASVSAAADLSTSSSNTVTGSKSDSKTEQKKSAYDEADYSDYQKEDADATTEQTGTGTSQAKSESNANSNTMSQEVSDAAGTSNEVIQHEAHLYGNIGVTTSQQMLKDELDVVTWNLYEHIADIFIDEFCILVY